MFQFHIINVLKHIKQSVMNGNNSVFDSLKGMAEKAHISEKINAAGEKIKDTLSDIDIKDVVEDVRDDFNRGGIKEAIHSVGDKLKGVASKATDAVKESLRENPGAAIDRADDDKVNPCMVKEDTAMLNNNPRNGDMSRNSSL